MSFRCKQKVKLASYVPVVAFDSETNKNGEVVMVNVDQSKIKLPDAELFDLKNQLEAGVDMEEVNSKVMSTNRVDAETVVRKYTRKAKEVTNE